MPIDLLGSSQPSVEVSGHSAAEVDVDRLTGLVEKVSEELSADFSGSVMTVHVYMPPYDDSADAPDGFMELWFHNDQGERALLSLDFAPEESWLDYELEDWTLEEALLNAETMDPHNHTVSFFNFDEAWQFVCRVGADLEVANVQLKYGI